MEFYISYTTENHPFQCYRKNKCGYKGNIYTLIFDQQRFEFLKDRDTGEYNPDKKLTLIEDVIDNQIDLSFPKFSYPIAFKKIEIHPYLENRFFNSYHKYEIGITQIDPKLKNEYIIFIIKQENQKVAYIGRHIKTKKELEEINEKRRRQGLKDMLRYRNSEADFSKILLGIDECTENTHTVIVVEGLFDKDRVDLLLSLDEQEETKCCATNGSQISNEQIYLLQKKNIKNLIVLYEADVLNKLQDNITNTALFFNSILVGYVEGNDPGEMDDEELNKVLLNLKSYSTFFETKVKKVFT